MKETKIYCDHCGKELDEMHDYIDLTIDLCWDIIHCDLCKNCIAELNSEVSVFVSKHKSVLEMKK